MVKIMSWMMLGLLCIALVATFIGQVMLLASPVIGTFEVVMFVALGLLTIPLTFIVCDVVQIIKWESRK